MTHSIYHPPIEAPFSLGAVVKVVSSSDGSMNEKHIGRIGKIQSYDYNTNVGQVYPANPLLIVTFGEDDIDSFWKEELVEYKRI